MRSQVNRIIAAVRACAVMACLSAMLASPLAAQGAERAVFLVRLGRDTLAVESASYARMRVEATLLLRTPPMRVHRVMTLSPAAEVMSAETTTGLGAHGDSARIHTVFTLSGDSGIVRIDDPAGAAPPTSHRVAVPRGAVPFANLSGQTLEIILRRARAMGGGASVPILLGNGQSVSVRVTYIGGDSAVLSLGGVDIRARTDSEGRLLGAAVPSQSVVFERLPADAPAAAWRPVPVSYEAPRGAPYTAEQVTVRTPAGITLAGTLTLPARRVGVRLPAVVLITGSGPQDRDEAIPSIGNFRPFREIADTLSRRGVAVLRLDDRGVGASSAGPSTATSADFADDIRAALAWLRTREEIDSARLGLVGHSEGGLIAPMIGATDTTLRALVLIAAQAKTGRAISAFQRRYAIEHDTTIALAQRDSAMTASDRVVDRLFATPGWLHFFADYDPLPTASRVRVPTLILQGETDRQVTAEQADELAAAMRAGGNRRVTVRTFPRMNHLMLEDASGDPSGYGRLPSYSVRRDCLGALVDWLVRTL